MDEKARIASALLASARTDSSPAVRSVASGTLARTCDPSQVSEVFEMLGSDDPGMRRLAVHSLATCHGQRARNAVLFAMDDPSPEVRKEAIQALGNMADPELVPKIMSALERETSPDILGDTDPRRNPTLKVWAASVVLRLANGGHRPLFVEYLRHARPEIHVVALAVLGKIGDASALPHVRERLEQHNLSVRRAAIEALGSLRDAESVTRICEIVADAGSSPILICAGAAALGAIGDTSAIEALTEAQQNASTGMESAAPGFESWYWRHQIIAKTAEALGSLDAEWKIIPAALKGLVGLCRVRSHASDARWVLEDVYRCDIGFATAVLEDAEIDSEKTLLGVFKDIRRLCDLLANHRDWKMRVAAAKHLMAARDKSVVPVLVEAMRGDTHPDVRRGIVEALSGLGDQGIVPDLLETVRREMVPAVRAAAVRGLTSLGGRSVVEHLLKLSTDHAAEVRRVALEGLSRLGGGDLLQPIMAAAKDADQNVRSTAALAIGFLRDGSALSTMIDMLKNDRHPAPRGSAAAALGLMSSSVAVGSLASALGDPAPSVRSQVARSLGEIGDASVIPKLEDCARFDEDPGVRSHCVLAMGRIAERLGAS